MSSKIMVASKCHKLTVSYNILGENINCKNDYDIIKMYGGL